MSSPKVAIVMSTYNPTETFREQISSIEAQQGVDLSIFIRDDGSSVDSKKIIKSVIQGKDRIFFTEGRNLGFKESFYRCLQKVASSGFDFFAYADQDDVWEKDKLSALISEIRRTNSVLAFSNGFVLRDGVVQGEIYSANHGFTSTLDFLYWPTYGMSFVFRRQLARLLVKGGVKPFIQYAHDGWAVLVASTFFQVSYLPQRLVYYRQHGTNAAGLKSDSRPKRGPIKMIQVVYARLLDWRYKVSDVAKDLISVYPDLSITDSNIKYLSRQTFVGRLRLLFNPKFTFHSAGQDFVARILILFNKI